MWMSPIRLVDHSCCQPRPCRLCGAAAAAASAVGGSLQPRSPLLLQSRSRSAEALSAGREPSARYLPTKRSGGRAALALAGGLPGAGRSTAAARWRRAAHAVADAREATRCLDLLSNRLAPPDDRLHAVFALGMRLQGYPAPDRLAWALQARRLRGRLPWWEHAVNELFITGGGWGRGLGGR